MKAIDTLIKRIEDAKWSIIKKVAFLLAAQAVILLLAAYLILLSTTT
jgi:hypothetical protein